mmetsp:Transcript_11887/g.30488  ORF Transcript_11887/g.30488 Transcript_11887/m.30488 type:complete len:200 (-) Transcript_11887:64-663(-)
MNGAGGELSLERDKRTTRGRDLVAAAAHHVSHHAILIDCNVRTAEDDVTLALLGILRRMVECSIEASRAADDSAGERAYIERAIERVIDGGQKGFGYLVAALCYERDRVFCRKASLAQHVLDCDSRLLVVHRTREELMELIGERLREAALILDTTEWVLERCDMLWRRWGQGVRQQLLELCIICDPSGQLWRGCGLLLC